MCYRFWSYEPNVQYFPGHEKDSLWWLRQSDCLKERIGVLKEFFMPLQNQFYQPIEKC